MIVKRVPGPKRAATGCSLQQVCCEELTWWERLVLGVDADRLLPVAHPGVGVLLAHHQVRLHARHVGPAAGRAAHKVLGRGRNNTHPHMKSFDKG